MIQASKVMNVTARDFFDMLVDSVLYDIKKSTGKKINRSQFHKGTNYRKKIKTNAKGKKGVLVKVTVTAFEAPYLYEATFSGDTDSTRIRYEIEELEDDQIRVTYSEDAGNVSGVNKPMRWLQTKIGQRNLKASLDGMEKAVQEHMAQASARKELDEEE